MIQYPQLRYYNSDDMEKCAWALNFGDNTPTDDVIVETTIDGEPNVNTSYFGAVLEYDKSDIPSLNYANSIFTVPSVFPRHLAVTIGFDLNIGGGDHFYLFANYFKSVDALNFECGSNTMLFNSTASGGVAALSIVSSWPSDIEIATSAFDSQWKDEYSPYQCNHPETP